jgi:hypothetical protein
VFEHPNWAERVTMLGHLWGTPGEQAFQSGGSWAPHDGDPEAHEISLVVMYPGIVTGHASNLTVETSVRHHPSFSLFQHYLMTAQMDESTLPIVIDRWRAPVPTELGPADFGFFGNDYSWAGEADFEGQTIRVTGSGRPWQDLELVSLEASDVLPLSQFAALMMARGKTATN